MHELPEGILKRIPKSSVSKEALDLAWRSLPEPIFNHSLRVFLIAQWLSERDIAASPSAFSPNQDLLFVACICHDLGASNHFNGPQRFEIEGADAAKNHLLSHGFSEQESHQAWIAIAVHTSSGIAEKIDGLSRLVRHGVLVDFSRATRKELNAESFSAEIEIPLPRLDVEKVLGDSVVGQAGHNHDLPNSLTWPNTKKHPAASWPGILLRAALENPSHDGINPAF